MLLKNFIAFVKHFYYHKSALLGLIIVLAIVILAIFAPLIAPNDPYDTMLIRRMQPSSSEYLLGTDTMGRCILSRLIYGTRVSLQVGFISVSIGLMIGGFLGLAAAFFGGWLNTFIMRIMDALLALPGLLIALVLIAALGPGLTNAMIAIGIGSFPMFARLMRGQALSLLSLDYVASARASGASNLRIMFRHIIPNAIPPLVVMATLRMASAILTEASLSFLGLGVLPPTASWGSMVAGGRSFILGMPSLSFYPGLMIIITVIGFNLFGDGIRDLLDPRNRGMARGD